MYELRLRTTLFAGAVTLLSVTAALAQDVPSSYPADYAQIIEAAKKEGTVAIYTSTDLSQAQAMIDAFSAKFPEIQVEYNDLGSNGTYNRVISEAAASQVGGDLVWSSAMDLQMKLAADGYFEPYESAEIENLPDWGSYKGLVYGTSIEPVGIIYNKGVLSEDQVPKTRADLISFLQSNKDELAGRIATFDPEKSGTGFLFHTNDATVTEDFWDLAKAFGQVGGKTYSSSGGMKETVVSGENVLAFNVIGSYALDWVKESANLGVAFGQDYTAAFSRLVGIAKGAPHPNAARVLVDFMLSQEGQSAMAAQGLPSMRTDVDTGFNLNTINERVGGNMKPIAIDEGLLEYMEPTKRVEFLREWKAALGS
ncbi:MAG: ABC transporter substrate-binding protein [Kiloniellales bacterium]